MSDETEKAPKAEPQPPKRDRRARRRKRASAFAQVMKRVSAGAENAAELMRLGRLGEKYVAPFDVLLKHPFHVSPLVNPYLGLGASLHLESYDGRREVLFALPFVVGTYLWWNRTVGLDVEVGYKLIFHSHLSHELEFSVGPVLQF